MTKKYVIGVDGGNTKTDYFLFDTEGNFIDGLRAGTCSHEAIGDSYPGSRREMTKQINELLIRNNLTINDISAGAFGLAGVDVPVQKANLEEIVSSIGFKNFIVVNDGFLGIKAGSPNGVGVCSINGTGTVSVGIDSNNNWMQVGGIGYVSGDEAGGNFFVRSIMKAAYDQDYRFGKETLLHDDVYEMLGLTDRSEYINKIVNMLEGKPLNKTELIKCLFKRANQGDEVAIKILADAGTNMALSIAGCINAIEIKGTVNVVLAGSVWVHATCPVMKDTFENKVRELTKQECDFIVLNAPPATGAVIWAIELATNKLPSDDLKNKILNNVVEYQNKHSK